MGTTLDYRHIFLFSSRNSTRNEILEALAQVFLMRLVVWFNEIEVAYPKSLGQNQQCLHRWISFSAFQAADVLLTQIRAFCDGLLSETGRFPNSRKIPPDEFPYVHRD